MDEKFLNEILTLSCPGDSRIPHYNVSPEGENPRFVVYTSYAPVFTASKEDLLRKKELFENTDGHSCVS